jgi:hypothetical protein
VNTRIAGVLYLLIVRVSGIECSYAVTSRVNSCNLNKKLVTSRFKYCKIYRFSQRVNVEPNLCRKRSLTKVVFHANLSFDCSRVQFSVEHCLSITIGA